MHYLVTGSKGPGFTSVEEMKEILEKGILPLFDMLIELEKNKKIIAGGLPVGDRSFTFILEAASNDEADQILRKLPAWGVLTWKAVPLQSFQNRADQERKILEKLK